MTKKETARDFLMLSAKGDSRKAFNLYVASNFKHHNAYFKGDANTLMIAMEENAKIAPNKTFEIQHILEDGDLVAAHSKVIFDQHPLGMAVTHIFRFEGGKIAELWDFAQAVPEKMINENGMF